MARSAADRAKRLRGQHTTSRSWNKKLKQRGNKAARKAGKAAAKEERESPGDKGNP